MPFSYLELIKLMLPTVFVLIATVLLFVNWTDTTKELLVQAERTYAAQGIAVSTSTALMSLVRQMGDLHATGVLMLDNTQVADSNFAAVSLTARILRGSTTGGITGGALPGLERSDSAFSILTSNACAAAPSMYNLTSCPTVDDGVLATTGLQGGTLRFTTLSEQLQGEMVSGAVLDGNSASAFIGNASRFNAEAFALGSATQTTAALLARLQLPNLIGVSASLASTFHSAALDIPTQALVASQVVIGVMLALLVLSLFASILPRVRRLGERVFAVHTLVAAVPAEVQVRLDAFHDVHKRILSLTAMDGDEATLGEESTLLMFSAEDEDDLGGEDGDMGGSQIITRGK